MINLQTTVPSVCGSHAMGHKGLTDRPPSPCAAKPPVPGVVVCSSTTAWYQPAMRKAEHIELAINGLANYNTLAPLLLYVRS
jgi:hypothetical protein